MASSGTSSSIEVINYGSQQYPYPSDVNAACFLSIKLSGEIDYDVWQEQMMCLLDKNDMLGFIDGTFKCPLEDGDYDKNKAINETAMEAKYREWKRSDTLVQGWIFGSLSKDVMATVVDLHTAHDVWERLNIIYSSPAVPTIAETTRSTSSTKDTAEYLPLHRAFVRGDWENAQEIFNKDRDALTAKFAFGNEPALHFAISSCENIQLVDNLLNEIHPESLPSLVDWMQLNALHRAAIAGNTTASKMLVGKNPHLLFMIDIENSLPIHRALTNSNKSTFEYLLAVSKQHIGLSQQDGYHNPFEGRSGAILIAIVIDAGLLGVASELIQEFPNLARTLNNRNNALMYIAQKRDIYFSATRYNFYQRFVYSYVPIENNDIHDADKIQDIENQGTYKTKFVTMCRRSSFHSVIKSIYVKFWEVTLLQVPHIKYLHDDKVKHNKALMLLKYICEEVVKLNSHSDLFGHFREAFFLAVENDIPEAIEVIVGCFPSAILTKKNDHVVSQIAIINRCEKVYNFLVHQVDKHLDTRCNDKNGNNLLHLAGKLAPIQKLNLVSGAALQMQRELQWFQEVKKFVHPTFNEQKNDESETPIMVFRREHKELRKDGEEWMKKTSASYTITAAFIITIAFSAAITIPGGNNRNTGKAIYATKANFIIFAISNAMSLFTSTTSLLLFLSILTARYRDEDFLYTLPKRLILGLVMLFWSVTSMVVAFSATLYLLFGPEKTWILILIAAFTCLPIASFMTLQFQLLVDMISSTYSHGIFAKHRDQIRDEDWLKSHRLN